jgi:hypothetical protein
MITRLWGLRWWMIGLLMRFEYRERPYVVEVSRLELL